jgi:hypothetical protein
MDHGLLWTKGAPMCEMHINEKAERFLNITMVVFGFS